MGFSRKTPQIVSGFELYGRNDLIAKQFVPKLFQSIGDFSGFFWSIDMVQFSKHPANPVIRRTPGTFFAKHAANPDLLEFAGTCFLYFRGQDARGHDEIGVAHTSRSAFDGVSWTIPAENPIIRVSPDPAEFDSGYILDPAAIIIGGKIYLYYTAHRADWQSWNTPSHIGLAVSDGGFHFEKSGNNPIIEGMAPEIIQHAGIFRLFFQRLCEDRTHFEIWCCTSPEGVHFSAADARIVFRPSGEAEAFDRCSISTVRIWHEHDWFYMTYGGCPKFIDYPAAIGLARSRNLRHWERYPGNPILAAGTPGAWDEGALWFATVFKMNSTYYLWYEGTGTASSLSNSEGREISRLCRQENYGGYGIASFSQIGLASFKGEIPDW